MKKQLLITGVVLGCLFLAVNGQATPQIMAVKFHADHCGNCKIMEPALKEVTKKYSQNDILFIRFDRTNPATSHQSELLAYALGLEEIYAQTDKTGQVLLIDAQTRDIRGKLNKNHSAVDMAMAIDAVLAGENILDASDSKKHDVKGSHHHDHGSMKGSH